LLLLPPHLLCSATSRVYEFQAVGSTPGSKEATVELVLPDDNPDNNRDETVVDLFLTCGNPFGNGTMASCAPLEFVGPADKRLLLDGSTFKAQCCVSAPLWLAMCCHSRHTRSTDSLVFISETRSFQCTGCHHAHSTLMLVWAAQCHPPNWLMSGSTHMPVPPREAYTCIYAALLASCRAGLMWLSTSLLTQQVTLLEALSSTPSTCELLQMTARSRKVRIGWVSRDLLHNFQA
jgi:hypothetical protein